MRKLGLLISGLLLSFVLACGGGHTSSSSASPAVPAKGLAYTDPSETGWRLVKDASSTSTRLVLDLIGPSGTLSRGVGFNLQAPVGVHFGTFAETGVPINDTGVYELLSQDPTYPLEPKLLAGGVKAGNLLTVGIFQKDRRLSAKDSGSALCQVALELDTSGNLQEGDALPLSVPKAKFMAGDIGAPGIGGWANDAEFYDAQAKAHLIPITIAVGTLVAR